MKQLGDVLLEAGHLTRAQLDAAVAEQQARGRSLGRVLVDLALLTEGQLAAALAVQIGMPYVDLAQASVDEAAVARVPHAVCRRHTVLPLAVEDGRLVVAMADPANVFAADDLRAVAGLEIRPVVAAEPDLLLAIERAYRADVDLDDLTSSLGVTDVPSAEAARAREVVDDAPIVRFVNLLITQAVQDRASDLHVEPGEKDLRVRFRIDGVLHDVMRSPRSIAAGVTSRLKIMADLDIAERRVPQDGRLSVEVSGRTVDLRVATLPTVWGEKVVLRVLDNSTAMLTLADLGFAADNAARWTTAVARPHGMILVTGPTGSGKSTTLYATLNTVNRPEVNVITVEDPVEYRLPGINQVQTNAKAGLTFAAALRSILRSDPDVVLLGEVRDAETAHIATEAALTGHLVLSTLHTNDAPSAVVRLTEMGVDPFLVGSALECVLAQRLARRLCTACRQPYSPTPQVLRQCRFPWQDGEPLPELFRPAGCGACSGTGYKGRLALHEVMLVTEEVSRLAVERAPAIALADVARQQGMTSLREDGMTKVAAGSTSLEEVLRVAV